MNLQKPLQMVRDMDGKRLRQNPLAEERVKGFLFEDLGSGDITSDALIPADLRARGQLYFREPDRKSVV